VRNDAKSQLKTVSKMIEKAKTSLEILEGSEATATLQTEPADIIPLGRFPDENGNHSEDN